jgi:formylglycine-generating enzyme required for sulfatase activity
LFVPVWGKKIPPPSILPNLQGVANIAIGSQDGSQGPEMVVVPAEDLTMGSPKSEKDRDEDEDHSIG